MLETTSLPAVPILTTAANSPAIATPPVLSNSDHTTANLLVFGGVFFFLGLLVFFVSKFKEAAEEDRHQNYRTDLADLVSSVRRYILENSTIFLILVSLSAIALAAWSVLTWE